MLLFSDLGLLKNSFKIVIKTLLGNPEWWSGFCHKYLQCVCGFQRTKGRFTRTECSAYSGGVGCIYLSWVSGLIWGLVQPQCSHGWPRM